MNPLLDNKWLKTAFASVLASSLGIICSQQLYALPSDRNQPIQLEADRATFNEKTGVTTYSGNVIIQQGTFKVQASSIVANLTQDSKIKNVTAQGSPAKFQQQVNAQNGLAKGEGRKIVYNAETGIVTLSGGAFLSQNGATFRGENLTYSMSKGDIEATGGPKGRIQIVIPPSTQQNPSGVRN